MRKSEIKAEEDSDDGGGERGGWTRRGDRLTGRKHTKWEETKEHLTLSESDLTE